MLQYLLDEHVDARLLKALVKRAPELRVWIIGSPGAPTKGILDPEILEWCKENEFILVTDNRSTMPNHLRDHILAGKHIPGIFILNPKMTIGQTVQELILVGGASDRDEYQDLILHLPISR